MTSFDGASIAPSKLFRNLLLFYLTIDNFIFYTNLKILISYYFFKVGSGLGYFFVRFDLFSNIFTLLFISFIVHNSLLLYCFWFYTEMIIKNIMNCFFVVAIAVAAVMTAVIMFFLDKPVLVFFTVLVIPDQSFCSFCSSTQNFCLYFCLNFLQIIKDLIRSSILVLGLVE